MEMRKRIYLFIGTLLIVGIAFGAGRFSKASKTEIVTKEVIKEVIKEVVVKKEKKDQTIVTDRVIKPDGTVTEHTTTTDNGQTDTTTEKEVDKESTKVSSNTTTRDSGLTLEALFLNKLNDLSGEKVYGVKFSKRIFGNLRAGLVGTTDKKIGLTIGLDF